jgi:hypothetical protein
VTQRKKNYVAASRNPGSARVSGAGERVLAIADFLADLITRYGNEPNEKPVSA